METIEFIGIIGCLALVVGWYLQNANNEQEPSAGLLALTSDPSAEDDAAPKTRYRMKSRAAYRTHERVRALRDGIQSGDVAQTPDQRRRASARSYRTLDDGARYTSFRPSNVSRYGRQGDDGRYKQRTGPTTSGPTTKAN